MRPVLQTKFYDPTLPVDEQRGNCLQAALASLLDLPLDEVPHFIQDHVNHDGETDHAWNWWHCMRKWLRNRGLSITSAGVRAPEPGEYVLATGPSPRGKGIHHAVISCDGLLAHDPHPDGTGLLSVDCVYMIRPFEKEEDVASVIYKHSVSEVYDTDCQCGGWVYDEDEPNTIHADHVVVMLDAAGLLA